MHNTAIFFDLEYTAWEGSSLRKWSEPWEHREIIQIAAIRVDAGQGMAELGCFDSLVKPRHNPLLSGYISALTGIVQADIEARGRPFPAAFADFYAFCGQGSLPLFCYGDDVSVLAENFALNDLPFAPFPAGIHDIRAVFQQAGIDTRRYTSGTVCQAVGADFEHAAHYALNDVRSIAITLRQLLRAGQVGAGWMEMGRFALGSEVNGN